MVGLRGAMGRRKVKTGLATTASPRGLRGPHGRAGANTRAGKAKEPSRPKKTGPPNSRKGRRASIRGTRVFLEPRNTAGAGPPFNRRNLEKIGAIREGRRCAIARSRVGAVGAIGRHQKRRLIRPSGGGPQAQRPQGACNHRSEVEAPTKPARRAGERMDGRRVRERDTGLWSRPEPEPPGGTIKGDASAIRTRA